jgi:hypothetical protein
MHQPVPMNATAYKLFFFVLCLACVSGCLQHDRSEEKGLSLQDLADSQEKKRTSWPLRAAYLPLKVSDSGLLFLWEDPEREGALGEQGWSPLRGSSGWLRLCTLRIFNFTPAPVTFPYRMDGAFEVQVSGRFYPLLPLGHFASEFSYPSTIQMLDQNHPEGEIPARTWIQCYMAIKIPMEIQNRVVPSLLSTGNDRSVPWFEIDPADWDKFLQAPCKEGLRKIIQPD